MSRALKYKQVIKALEYFGYIKTRQRGSHIIFVNNEGKITVVPKHTNGEVMAGTVGKICRDIDILYEEFEKHIR
ncbi:TPA: hypothetical protein DEP94_03625 [Candidatus Nomurabacteria bacterium]|nr:hypothetical protein [Candidatus Nomurabacteria bacterium]